MDAANTARNQEGTSSAFHAGHCSVLPVPFYDRDGITIYHGDCREILPLLGRFDLLLTDPPYGLGDKWQGGAAHTKARWKLNDGGAEMGWDADAPTELVMGMLSKAEKAIIWGGNYFPLPPQRGWLLWDKIVRQFSSGHAELAWTNLDQPVRAFNFAHGQLASEGKLHPTQKPLTLIQWCIQQAGDVETILDPFAGSGTTGHAAKNLGKRAVLIEREERFCAMAVDRLAQDVLQFHTQNDKVSDGGPLTHELKQDANPPFAAPLGSPFMKHEYHLESFAIGKWLKILQGSLQYCQGFLDARKDYAPRNAYRLMRSDGRVMEEVAAREDVNIGQIAGWPTAVQYETAANKALERAKAIRERANVAGEARAGQD